MARTKKSTLSATSTTKKTKTTTQVVEKNILSDNQVTPRANGDTFERVSISDLSSTQSLTDTDLIFVSTTNGQESKNATMKTVADYVASKVPTSGSGHATISPRVFDDYKKLGGNYLNTTSLSVGANDRFAYEVTNKLSTVIWDESTFDGKKTFSQLPVTNETVTSETEPCSLVTKQYVDDEIAKLGGAPETYVPLLRWDVLPISPDGNILSNNYKGTPRIKGWPESTTEYCVYPSKTGRTFCYMKEPYTNFSDVIFIIGLHEQDSAGNPTAYDKRLYAQNFTRYDTKLLELYFEKLFKRSDLSSVGAWMYNGFNISDTYPTNGVDGSFFIVNTRHSDYLNTPNPLHSTVSFGFYLNENDNYTDAKTIYEIYGVTRKDGKQLKQPTKHICDLNCSYSTTVPNDLVSKSDDIDLKSDEYYSESHYYQIESSDLENINQSYNNKYDNQLMFTIYSIGRTSNASLTASFNKTPANVPYYKLKLLVQKCKLENGSVNPNWEYNNSDLSAWDVLGEFGTDTTENPVSGDVKALNGRIPQEQYYDNDGYFRVDVSKYKLEVGDRFKVVSFFKYNGYVLSNKDDKYTYAYSTHLMGYANARTQYYGIRLLA